MNWKNFLFKTAVAILLLSNGAFFNLNAQVTIGDVKTPESFSLLELVSNETRGLRLPQMTTAQRKILEDSFGSKADNEAMGLQIFNTDKMCIETWNGSKWIVQCAAFEQDNPVGTEICGGTNHTLTLAPATGGAGVRYNGSGNVGNIGTVGYYWSSTVDGDNVRSMGFSSTSSIVLPGSSDGYRAYGMSV